MTEFIVVGVSSRSGSPGALRWAAAEAHRRGCALVAVRAWRAPRPPSAPGAKPPAVRRDVTEDFAAGEDLLRADVAAALGDNHDVTCKLVEGAAVTVLLKESSGALLLVLDTPRKIEVKARTLLAQRLVYRATCPVVVMPPALVADRAAG